MSITDLLYIEEVDDRKKATHIAIFKNSNIKYLFDLQNNGKEKLVEVIESYTMKHRLLKSAIACVPENILTKSKDFHYVRVDTSYEVKECYHEFFAKKNVFIKNINYLIGTPGIHQKIIIQINTGKENYYIKAGNSNTLELMQNEYDTIRSLKFKYREFDIPEILSKDNINENYFIEYKEFTGKKVKPVITDEIYNLYKNISSINDKRIIKGIPYEFSHGDFAPWNLKKRENSYLIFDWEYSGYRFIGYDLIHYIFQIETLLKKKKDKDAIKIALNYAYRKINYIKNINSEYLSDLYFSERKKNIN